MAAIERVSYRVYREEVDDETHRKELRGTGVWLIASIPGKHGSSSATAAATTTAATSSAASGHVGNAGAMKMLGASCK